MNRTYKLSDILAVVLVLILLGIIINAILDALLPPYSPLEQVHQQLNHVRIYEDGSYIGEDRQGNPVSGCIAGALCND